MSTMAERRPAQRSSKSDKLYRLRGYIRQIRPGEFVGVCLTLNLVVKGASQSEARRRLKELIDAYVDDAIENDEVDEFIPRRAPWSFYLEYLQLWLRSALHFVRAPFTLLNEVRPLQRHA
jgi:hypothetical protein